MWHLLIITVQSLVALLWKKCFGFSLAMCAQALIQRNVSLHEEFKSTTIREVIHDSKS